MIESIKRTKPVTSGTPWLVAVLLTLGLGGCSDEQQSMPQTRPATEKTLSYEDAKQKLNAMLRGIDATQLLVSRKARLKLDSDPGDLMKTLPEIDEYPMTVDPQVTDDDVVVEIFVTTTRSGAGTDGRMVEVAKAFNLLGKKTSDGRTAKVRVRKITSGTAYQFIASRKYLPDAFTPVHQLWIEMAAANGVPMTKIRDSMVRSVGGIVMKNKVAAQIKSRHGEISVKALIDDVVQGNIAMGYTNPFASSTGLNFLVTVLSTFSGGDESKLLSPDVVSAFQEFQRSVPFVAMTTLHMRESVSRVGGSLDAFVMGHQTFSKTRELASGYEFIPFGVPHNHPLYAVDNPGSEKLEVLELLARYAEESKNLQLATDYGWNQPIAGSYQSSVPMPSGDALIRAQKLWKEQKDAGRPIAAVFLCDVSGSMQGSRINGVKEALITGSEFISPDNSIGLVFFNNAVVEVLEIKRFNLLQRASFVAAVEDMDASGGTAMYNGIAYALSLLLKAKEADPKVKPMLFVLTDGQTQSGLKFGDIRAVIEGVRVPVYTIGYEADLKELKRLSGLVEAASINAGEGQIEYKIGALLNAQM